MRCNGESRRNVPVAGNFRYRSNKEQNRSGQSSSRLSHQRESVHFVFTIYWSIPILRSIPIAHSEGLHLRANLIRFISHRVNLDLSFSGAFPACPHASTAGLFMSLEEYPAFNLGTDVCVHHTLVVETLRTRSRD